MARKPKRILSAEQKAHFRKLTRLNKQLGTLEAELEQKQKERRAKQTEITRLQWESFLDVFRIPSHPEFLRMPAANNINDAVYQKMFAAMSADLVPEKGRNKSEYYIGNIISRVWWKLESFQKEDELNYTTLMQELYSRKVTSHLVISHIRLMAFADEMLMQGKDMFHWTFRLSGNIPLVTMLPGDNNWWTFLPENYPRTDIEPGETLYERREHAWPVTTEDEAIDIAVKLAAQGAAPFKLPKGEFVMPNHRSLAGMLIYANEGFAPEA